MSVYPDDRPTFTKHESRALGETYYEAVHPCGLRMLIEPKDVTSVYAAVGVGYGSLHHAPDEPQGLAHFLEHKMFERRDGREADSVFASLGAEVNAYTGFDRTAYEFTCTDHFEEALSELLRMVDSLHVTAASVEREKDIIAEEIRMSLDDPWERLNAELLRTMYAAHPIREEICGSEAEIARVTPELLRRTYRARYGLDRMVLTVSGRVTPEVVYDTVDAYIGARPRKPARHRHKGGTLPVDCPQEPRTVGKPRTVVYMDEAADPAAKPAAKPLFAIGIKDPAVPTDPAAARHRELCLSVLSEMLFSSSEDFYNDLFETGLVAAEVSNESTIGCGYGFCCFSGESPEPDKVFDAFRDYVDRLHAGGLPRDAFRRCLRPMYADFVAGFDSTESIGTGLLNDALDGLDLFDSLPALERVTFEAVTDLFNEIFRPEQYALVVLHPADN